MILAVGRWTKQWCDLWSKIWQSDIHQWCDLKQGWWFSKGAQHDMTPSSFAGPLEKNRGNVNMDFEAGVPCPRYHQHHHHHLHNHNQQHQHHHQNHCWHHDHHRDHHDRPDSGLKQFPTWRLSLQWRPRHRPVSLSILLLHWPQAGGDVKLKLSWIKMNANCPPCLWTSSEGNLE